MSFIFVKNSEMYLENKIENGNAWGLLACINLRECDLDKIKNLLLIRKYIDDLCNLIDMEKYGELVYDNFGKDLKVKGYSCVQLIETSSITCHFVEENNSAYIDIFSCKFFDPYVASEFTSDYFGSRYGSLDILWRR